MQVLNQQHEHEHDIEKSEDHLEEDEEHHEQPAEKKKQPKPVSLQIDPNRPRYGRMKVLLEKPFMISIGPDYPCFIGGFIFFAGLAYLLCSTVSSVFQNQKMILITYFLSLLQCGSYLLVALSNPNIALREQNPIKQVTTQNQHRVCKQCGAQLRRRTYHCRECDVCVNGYDHHCPWTSKCIGEGNLYRFYFFVTITPIYILAFIGLMMGCLMVSAQQMNQNLKKN